MRNAPSSQSFGLCV